MKPKVAFMDCLYCLKRGQRPGVKTVLNLILEGSAKVLLLNTRYVLHLAEAKLKEDILDQLNPQNHNVCQVINS